MTVDVVLPVGVRVVEVRSSDSPGIEVVPIGATTIVKNIGGAGISADAGNAITTGTDSALFVPEAFAVAARFSEIAANPTAVTEARQNLGLQDIDGGTFA